MVSMNHNVCKFLFLTPMIHIMRNFTLLVDMVVCWSCDLTTLSRGNMYVSRAPDLNKIDVLAITCTLKHGDEIDH